MEVKKSTRHSRITGDFAEGLILYWLSKYGFECARVDHTGMDLIARNPHNKELMGISVKSRSRNPGTEHTYLKIDRDNIDKLKEACAAFGCTPYFAVVVDAAETIRCYIMRMEHLIAIGGEGRDLGIKMRPRNIEQYCADPEIICFEFQSMTTRWWPH